MTNQPLELVVCYHAWPAKHEVTPYDAQQAEDNYPMFHWTINLYRIAITDDMYSQLTRYMNSIRCIT